MTDVPNDVFPEGIQFGYYYNYCENEDWNDTGVRSEVSVCCQVSYQDFFWTIIFIISREESTKVVKRFLKKSMLMNTVIVRMLLVDLMVQV